MSNIIHKLKLELDSALLDAKENNDEKAINFILGTLQDLENYGYFCCNFCKNYTDYASAIYLLDIGTIGTANSEYTEHDGEPMCSCCYERFEREDRNRQALINADNNERFLNIK
jgi:hypothetical protein